jgi:hypothetical protein
MAGMGLRVFFLGSPRKRILTAGLNRLKNDMALLSLLILLEMRGYAPLSLKAVQPGK